MSLRQGAARAGATMALLIGVSAWAAAPTVPGSPLPVSGITASPIRLEVEPAPERIAQAPQTPTPVPAPQPQAPATAQEAPAAPPVSEDEQQALGHIDQHCRSPDCLAAAPTRAARCSLRRFTCLRQSA